MKINVYDSPLTTCRSLIEYIIERLSNHPDKVFNIAFSGGDTPLLMFDLWANEFADATPWERIRFFWVDERCVRPESIESNYGQMKRVLLDVVNIPGENIFRIRGEENPVYEAARYSDVVMRELPVIDGCPVFDIVLLGVGTDGHTSSIFPGQEHLLSSSHVYEASVHPSSGQKRVAMTGFPIFKARQVIFLVTGKNKAQVVDELFLRGDVTPATYIARRAQKVELFLDKAAAGERE